jgi:hypothetical protein
MTGDTGSPTRADRRAPLILFLLAALATLGAAAGLSSWEMNAQDINKDVWQHAAALRALMADLADPRNPFVASDDTSRHFHPLWVGMAAVARGLDLTVWQALTLASVLSMAVLGVGIHAFARAFYGSPWGSFVLLMTVLAGWAYQPHHTGFHSFHTLLFAAPYPATVMVGLCLLIWALTIRALQRWPNALILVPLTAVMFATHQLGTVIGLIGAGSFILFWPEGGIARRVLVSGAILLGLGLSLLWPYHNPLGLILRPGNSDWLGGPNFFNPAFVALCTVPVAIGVLGLRNARGRPVLAMLLVLAIAYAVGFAGPQVTGRFLMPIVLCLQIGVVALILKLLDQPRIAAIPPPRCAALMGAMALLWLLASLTSYVIRTERLSWPAPSPYAAALELAADIPDTQEVAAFDLAAWPIVATGQRVHSIPWPEPGIPDLAARQDATLALFDPGLTPGERLAQAEALGVRTLFADARITPRNILDTLSRQAVRRSEFGTLIRFDLAD